MLKYYTYSGSRSLSGFALPGRLGGPTLRGSSGIGLSGCLGGPILRGSSPKPSSTRDLVTLAISEDVLDESAATVDDLIQL